MYVPSAQLLYSPEVTPTKMAPLILSLNHVATKFQCTESSESTCQQMVSLTIGGAI